MTMGCSTKRPPTAYRHAFRDRALFAMLYKVPESEDDACEAWSLLATREVLEGRMTEIVRSRLARRRIKVLAAG
jgi:hypothetical protein